MGGWEQKDGKTKNTSQNMVKIYTYAPLVPVYDKYLQPIQHCYNTSIRVGGALLSNPPPSDLKKKNVVTTKKKSKKMEMMGIDPTTCRMLSDRSTI